MRTHLFIYCLVNPISGKPFYVGAAQQPNYRYANHLSHLPEMKPTTWQGKRFRLIKSLLSKGLAPELRILAKVKIENAGRWEKHYYTRFTNEGNDMLQSKHKFYNPSKHIFAMEWIKKKRKTVFMSKD